MGKGVVSQWEPRVRKRQDAATQYRLPRCLLLRHIIRHSQHRRCVRLRPGRRRASTRAAFVAGIRHGRQRAERLVAGLCCQTFEAQSARTSIRRHSNCRQLLHPHSSPSTCVTPPSIDDRTRARVQGPTMADNNGVPRRKPVPQRPSQEPLPDNWASDLTQEFRRTLSTKRMNALSSRSRPGSQRRSTPRLVVEPQAQQPPSQPQSDATNQQPPPLPSRDAPQPPQQTAPSIPPPPSYASLKNLPIVATPPTDQRSLVFRNMLLHLSQTPLKWENPGLLDEALGKVPLQRIYDEAQEESDLFEAEAASLGPNTKPAWGYQDCVIRALMKWFKRDFFEWVNNPRCSTCFSPTVAHGMAAPLPDEVARGASRVELYQCANAQCLSFERFPRYNDAFVLLETKRGRCGEWVNCFSMLCRAMGGRVRWVWNAEDHVWTEVYSVHRKRWVHVDCCEESWDAPLVYAHGMYNPPLSSMAFQEPHTNNHVGWNKKMSYIMAFSADGCADVTRRYVRNPSSHGLPRKKCPEGVLIHIINEINALRRRDMEKKQRFQLNAEDMKEDAEFRRYIIESLAFNIGRLSPGGDGEKGRREGRPDPDAQKAAEGRQSGSRSWVRNRGEGGQQQNQDQRQQ